VNPKIPIIDAIVTVRLKMADSRLQHCVRSVSMNPSRGIDGIIRSHLRVVIILCYNAVRFYSLSYEVTATVFGIRMNQLQSWRT